MVEDFDFRTLYYLSTHFLDSAENAEYGKTRVLRELLEAWCEKKMTFAGIKYEDSEIKLSDEELSQIPGSEVIKSVDALKLEVTVRSGSAIEIHPDQIKTWRTQGGNYAEEFEKLFTGHNTTYKNMLAGVIGSTSSGASSQQVVAAEDTQGPGSDPPPVVTDFESVEALKAQDEISYTAVSEIADVELLRGKSGSTYLVAVKKNKEIPRHTIIGGFGTGKLLGFKQLLLFFCFLQIAFQFFISNIKRSWTCVVLRFVPVAAPDEGLLFEWPEADKTLVSVDHGSINPESTNTEVMTLYRYLVLLERQKKIVKYDMSYSEISRVSGGETDGFSVKISQGHKFKIMNDTSKPATCKTWFGDSISKVEASSAVQKVFRVRFDRVNACSKLQKPYVMLKHAISLQIGRPVKVCGFEEFYQGAWIWYMFRVLQSTIQ